MSKYCLDTNIISLLTGNYKMGSKNFVGQENIKKNLNIDNLCITEYTKFEILHGINSYKKSKKGKSYEELDENHKLKLKQFRNENRIISSLVILDLDEYSLGIYKNIIEFQYKKGFNQKNHCDYFISAIYLKENLVLITNNEKDFIKIDGLEIENWTRP